MEFLGMVIQILHKDQLLLPQGYPLWGAVTLVALHVVRANHPSDES